MKQISRNRGFTLIEVLVVVAIIALLVAVLLPSLSAARKSARAALCMTNVHQLEVGYHTYSLSRRDALMSYDPYVLYLLVLTRELGGVNETRKCPDGPLTDPSSYYGTATHTWTWTDSDSSHKWYGSYAMNGFFYDRQILPHQGGWNYFKGSAPADLYPNAWFKNLTEVKQPALTPLFGDAYWVDCWPFNGYTGPSSMRALTDECNDTPYTNQLARYVINRHSMRTNLSYTDGHAARVLLKELPHQQWSAVYRPGADVVRWP